MSSRILDPFSASDVCTVPDTAKQMTPWRNSHDTQWSHGLLWEQFPEHLQPPMRMLLSFTSHKPPGCVWTDRSGWHQTERRVTSVCCQSSPSVRTCFTGEPPVQSHGQASAFSTREDGWAATPLAERHSNFLALSVRRNMAFMRRALVEIRSSLAV